MWEPLSPAAPTLKDTAGFEIASMSRDSQRLSRNTSRLENVCPTARDSSLSLGVFVSLTLLLLLAVARAEQLPIRKYTMADGLARDQINRIVRDSRGYLWLCTPEGLSRFDGYRFTNYTVAQGLPHRSVRDLLETRSGTYWVATGDGLCRFTAYASQTRRSSESPSKMDRSPGDALFVTYHLLDNGAARSIRRLYEDRTGMVWVGTLDGLYWLEQTGDRVKFHFVELGMPTTTSDDRLIEAILEDRHGSLWVGTRGSGL